VPVSVRILIGDCRERMKELPDTSVDSVVCDPPYHLTSIVKRFGKSHLDVAAHKDPSTVKVPQFGRLSKGFMGQTWDGGDVAFQPETWAEVLRVLKPGGHLVAFSGTRTSHRMAVAIEDAGFEVRDQLAWVYGSGFPKSHNQPGGWGTALKPSWEPICLARRPLDGTVAANIAEHGTGAINIDGCRIDGESTLRRDNSRMTSAGKQGGAYGSGGYPAGEPRTNGSTIGRWPANIIHDGSDEVLARFPDSDGAAGAVGPQYGPKSSVNAYGDWGPRQEMLPRGDCGSAARFFYCAKTTTEERGEGNNHPTVKPGALMRWLVRLVTPAGGTVLDPFMGSGSTGLAADAEQFDFVGCEMSPDYAASAERRIRDAAGLFGEVQAA
jgi:site-specific DNA-methyltransferase (adenine-specific)